jgi:peptidoglycan-N-acetylglucosamine deacetylase
MPLPAASISLDLDNQWAYLKTQGIESWSTFPSYLDKVVPRILGQLEQLDQKITFFVVGADAERAENHSALSSIAAAGHEIANHSYLHEPWLHLYSPTELNNDFDRTERALEAISGRKPVGFRGPGFSSSPAVRAELCRRGYQYDASVFPTVIGPLARTYFMLKSNLSPEEKAKRSGLYGSFRSAFGSLSPYAIEPGLMEMPVTTLPLLRLPVHMSYLLFLAQFSEGLARMYWRTALMLCRVRGISPSMLLHPTDYLDITDVPEFTFFPGIRIPAARKMNLVRDVIASLQRHYRPTTMLEHQREVASQSIVSSPSLTIKPQPFLSR